MYTIWEPGHRQGGGGGQCPGAELFGRAALLVKRRNSKLSFTNEPEVRFRFRL